jgi:hypothetical protein
MLRWVSCWNVFIVGDEPAGSIFRTEDRERRSSETLVMVYSIIRCHIPETSDTGYEVCLHQNPKSQQRWELELSFARYPHRTESKWCKHTEPLSKQLPCEQRPSQSTRFRRWRKERLGAEASGRDQLQKDVISNPIHVIFWIILCCEVVAYFIILIYMQWTNGSYVLLVRMCVLHCHYHKLCSVESYDY